MSFAIGVEHSKLSVNIGTLWRSAQCFGASLVFTVGRRYEKQASDVLKTTRHVPVLHFPTWNDFRAHQWPDWDVVLIEKLDGIPELSNFSHPRSAIYLLGPEDGSISKEVLSWPNVRKVQIGGAAFCLNVATAGSLVMWHRWSQLNSMGKHVR